MKRPLTLVLLYFLTTFSSYCADSRATDSLALRALYLSTDGENWSTTWDLSKPISDWHGVILTNERVSLLNLQNNNLSGILPDEIGDLSMLKDLYLSDNPISGNIPTAIGNLSNIELIWLGRCDLTGSIPSTISDLSFLRQLLLYENDMEGELPTSLGELTNLTSLNLSTNNFSGTIPSELGSLTNLTSLSLSQNSFSGAIPVEFGNLTQLTGLSLGSNNLVGSIPVELGNLTLLTSLNLQKNNLSGSIPTSIGNLSKLVYLRLYENQLEGEIPKEFGSLQELSWLFLSKNQLSGSLPMELGDLSNLKYLFVGLNELSGDIPTSFVNMTKLENLWLSENNFKSIPDLSELPNFDSYGLEVDNNRLGFADIIPNLAIIQNGAGFDYSPQRSLEDTIRLELSIGSDYTMQTMENTDGTSYQWIKDNTEISGANSSAYTITDFTKDDEGEYTCKMTNLSVPDLTLYRSPIFLSDDVEDPTNSVLESDSLALRALYFSTKGENWSTSWDLSKSISNWHGITIKDGRIVEVGLSNNNLNGTLPDEIGNLSELRYLRVHGNKLNGQVPSSYAGLTKLENFSLSENYITSIPNFSSLTSLDNNGIEAENNRLDFAHIIPNLVILQNGAGFRFSPQKSFEDTIRLELSNNSDYSMSIIQDVEGTDYQWTKNNQDIDGAISSSYEITNFSKDDGGEYSCKKTNALVAGLILYRSPIILTTKAEDPVISSVINNNKAGYRVYPTRTNHLISIDFLTKRQHNSKIQLFNLNGKTILEFNNFKKNLVLDISNLEKGIYVICISDSNGQSTSKIIKD